MVLYGFLTPATHLSVCLASKTATSVCCFAWGAICCHHTRRPISFWCHHTWLSDAFTRYAAPSHTPKTRSSGCKMKVSTTTQQNFHKCDVTVIRQRWLTQGHPLCTNALTKRNRLVRFLELPISSAPNNSLSRAFRGRKRRLTCIQASKARLTVLLSNRQS